MTIEKLKIYFAHNLEGLYPSEEIESFFFLLVEKHLNFSKERTNFTNEFESERKEYKNNIRYAKKLIYLNIQFNLFQSKYLV